MGPSTKPIIFIIYIIDLLGPIPSFLIPYRLLRPKSLVLGAPSEGYASASVTAAKSLMRPVPSKRVRRGHKRPKNIKFISFGCLVIGSLVVALLWWPSGCKHIIILVSLSLYSRLPIPYTSLYNQ